MKNLTLPIIRLAFIAALSLIFIPTHAEKERWPNNPTSSYETAKHRLDQINTHFDEGFDISDINDEGNPPVESNTALESKKKTMNTKK